MRYRIEYAHDGAVFARLFCSDRSLRVLSRHVRDDGMITLDGDITDAEGAVMPSSITLYVPHIISIAETRNDCRGCRGVDR